jgi:hypothetical protein
LRRQEVNHEEHNNEDLFFFLLFVSFVVNKRRPEMAPDLLFYHEGHEAHEGGTGVSIRIKY